MRNIKGLLHGTREGEMYFENECDNVTKGKRKIVDKTRKVQSGESAEFSDQSGELGERSEE